MPNSSDNQKPIDCLSVEAPAQYDDPLIRAAKPTTLADLQTEGVALFTPALIVKFGLFDRDPVVEFCRTHQTNAADERIFSVDSVKPFFQDIGTSELNGKTIDWDRRLYGVLGDYWNEVRDFMCALAIMDTRTGHYARVGYHVLTIVDPTALGTTRATHSLPMLNIYVFCVASNSQFVWLSPAKDPPRTQAYPRIDPPRLELISKSLDAVNRSLCVQNPINPDEESRNEDND